VETGSARWCGFGTVSGYAGRGDERQVQCVLKQCRIAGLLMAQRTFDTVLGVLVQRRGLQQLDTQQQTSHEADKQKVAPVCLLEPV
jgi:hypothetical protein